MTDAAPPPEGRGVAAVGVDVGSTSVKAVALDDQGRVQARSTRPLVDEMDVISLPGGGQVLKFMKKVDSIN